MMMMMVVMRWRVEMNDGSQLELDEDNGSTENR